MHGTSVIGFLLITFFKIKPETFLLIPITQILSGKLLSINLGLYTILNLHLISNPKSIVFQFISVLPLSWFILNSCALRNYARDPVRYIRWVSISRELHASKTISVDCHVIV